MERFWPNLKKLEYLELGFFLRLISIKKDIVERERERSFFSTLGLLSLGLV